MLPLGKLSITSVFISYCLIIPFCIADLETFKYPMILIMSLSMSLATSFAFWIKCSQRLSYRNPTCCRGCHFSPRALAKTGKRLWMKFFGFLGRAWRVLKSHFGLSSCCDKIEKSESETDYNKSCPCLTIAQQDHIFCVTVMTSSFVLILLTFGTFYTIYMLEPHWIDTIRELPFEQTMNKYVDSSKVCWNTFKNKLGF